MITFNQIYSNVKDLPKEFEHLKDIYNNTPIRIIVESLFFDKETPKELFEDLVGFNIEDIEVYNTYLFALPGDTPRLEVISLIESAGEYFKNDDPELQDTRYKLYKQVFDYGWGYIDETYNQSKRLEINKLGLRYFKQMLASFTKSLPKAITAKDMQVQKQMLSMIKEGLNLFKDNTSQQETQLELVFADLLRDNASGVMSSGMQEIFPNLKVDAFGNVEDTPNANHHDKIMRDLAEKEETPNKDGQLTIFNVNK